MSNTYDTLPPPDGFAECALCHRRVGEDGKTFRICRECIARMDDDRDDVATATMEDVHAVMLGYPVEADEPPDPALMPAVFILHLRPQVPDADAGRKLAWIVKRLLRDHGFELVHAAEWPADLADVIADARNRDVIAALAADQDARDAGGTPVPSPARRTRQRAAGGGATT